jgi:hypothetical protein
LALEEKVFNRFVVLTENTPCTSMPVSLNKIVFGENKSLTKVPSIFLYFLMESNTSKAAVMSYNNPSDLLPAHMGKMLDVAF